MQTVATQSNLVIKSFKPAPVVTKKLHAEWPIQLELEGSYHNLATFFDRVGKFTRIVNITGVDIRGATTSRRSQRDDRRHLRGDDIRAARRPGSGRGQKQSRRPARRGCRGRKEGR